MCVCVCVFVYVTMCIYSFLYVCILKCSLFFQIAPTVVI